MASLAATRSNIRQLLATAKKDAKEIASKARSVIVTPSRLQKAADGATRMGQIIALLLLGPVIMVSLALIRVVNTLMVDTMLGQDLSGQEGILGWLVTFLTLLLLIITAWGWFQFVRTAGFGRFSFD